jgi:pyruvate formate lyase activating enzyme
MMDTARYIGGLNEPKEVNFMPYHRYGEGKYKMLDRRYRLSKLTSPEDSQIEKLASIFRSFNLNCEIVK